MIDRSFETHINVLVPILNGIREGLDYIELLFTTGSSVDFDKYLIDVENLSKNICEIEKDTTRYKNSTGINSYLYGPNVIYGTIFGNNNMSTGVNDYKKIVSARNSSSKNIMQFLPRNGSNERKIATRILNTWDLVDSTNAITEELIDFLNSNDCKFRQFIINGYSTVV